MGYEQLCTCSGSTFNARLRSSRKDILKRKICSSHHHYNEGVNTMIAENHVLREENNQAGQLRRKEMRNCCIFDEFQTMEIDPRCDVWTHATTLVKIDRALSKGIGRHSHLDLDRRNF
jgi:hypothetical protein